MGIALHSSYVIKLWIAVSDFGWRHCVIHGHVAMLLVWLLTGRPARAFLCWESLCLEKLSEDFNNNYHATTLSWGSNIIFDSHRVFILVATSSNTDTLVYYISSSGTHETSNCLIEKLMRRSLKKTFFFVCLFIVVVVSQDKRGISVCYWILTTFICLCCLGKQWTLLVVVPDLHIKSAAMSTNCLFLIWKFIGQNGCPPFSQRV